MLPNMTCKCIDYPISCNGTMNTESTLETLLFNAHRICTLPVGLGHFCQKNAHDPLLFRVLLFNINGWFRTVDPEFATIGDNSGVWMSDMGNQNHRDLYCFKNGYSDFFYQMYNI